MQVKIQTAETYANMLDITFMMSLPYFKAEIQGSLIQNGENHKSVRMLIRCLRSPRSGGALGREKVEGAGQPGECRRPSSFPLILTLWGF